MTLQQAIKTLELHQQWRLGLRDDFYPKPKEITEALDIVLNEVKNQCPECNGTGRWKDDECDPEIDCPKCKRK